MQKIVLTIIFCFSLTALFAQSSNEQLAFQYFRDKEFEKANELFAELYKQNPTHYYYSYYLQTLLQLDDAKEAEKLVKKQMKLSPNVQRYNIDLGYVYERQGDASKAKKQYESSISAITSNNSAVMELSRAFQSYRLNDYAIKTYLHGRKLSNSSTAYAGEIAAIYESNNEYEKAMNEYINLLNENEDMLNFVETQLTNWLIGDDEDKRSEIIRIQLLKSINKNPDNKAYSSLMIWFSMQKRDFASALKQAKAMDKRYNEDGRRIIELATISAENYDFNTAIDGYNYIIGRGETTIFYHDAQMMLLNLKLTQATMTYPANLQQVQAIDKELAQFFQSKTVHNANFRLYRRWISLKAVQLKDAESAIKMINQHLSSNNIGAKEKALLKLDMGDILQLEEDVWEASLLYSQVEKDFPNDTIGHTAKFKNAKLSFHIGEFEWAKVQLDVLRAATSKLIANDAMYFSLLISDNQNEEDSVNLPLKQFAKADFLMEIHRYDEALQLLETIENQNTYHSLLDDILYKKAKIAVIKQDYAKADKLYETLIKNYPSELLANESLFERAKLQEIYLKDSFKAMELYQQLLLDYPDSIYTIEARARFRALRGDVIKMGD